jgi:hypothetical protein
MEERIQGLRKSVTEVSQFLQSPKSWIGSGSINVLRVLCDLLDIVQQMNVQLASHAHIPGSTPTLNDAAAFSARATETKSLFVKLTSITL